MTKNDTKIDSSFLSSLKINITILLATILFCKNFIISEVQASNFNTKRSEFRHFISFNGKAKYPENFNHFDYVDLSSKIGGEIHFGIEGGFNSLNPFLLKGKPAVGLNHYLFETLTVSSDDEFGVRYGLIAKEIAFDYDNNFIEFKINNRRKN